MINEDKYIDFIVENKVTQKQFLLLHLVYRNRWDLLSKYKKAFPTNDGTIIGRQETDDLIDRGFIIYSKDHTGKVVDLRVSDEFRKSYTNEIYIAEEIYNVYPNFYQDDNGINYPLTAYDRMAFAKIYLDKIHYSQKEHEEILEDIKFGKENNLIKIKISNFLTSDYWKVLRELRHNKEIEDKSNNQILDDEQQDFS